ncbi:GGDEF domain-containing protein [Roseospira navarrensis]|nr:GGDEF domain-containing protein [Roseospira navarrensis]
MLLGVSSAPVLLAFSIYDVIRGQYLFGGIIAAFALAIAANTAYIHRTGRVKIPFAVMNVVGLLTLAWGIQFVGHAAALWAYPLAIVNCFVSERRRARIMMAAGMLLLIPLVLLEAPMDHGVRFALTYPLTCWFSDLAVSILEKLQHQLNEFAIRDPLTGAYNRRCFDFRLDEAIEQSRRDLGAVSLISFDIDHFKAINDQFGHDAGDDVLVHLVRTVRARLRKVDALFRMGGEEFMVLCRGTTPQQAQHLAEALRREVMECRPRPDLPVTISLGVVQYDDRLGRAEGLRRVDQNLYAAKQTGRNTVWPPAESAESELPAA